MDNKLIKRGAAELFGTAVLVIGGCGTAVLAGKVVGVLGIAIAFGLTVLTMAYAIGNISGCHINPAITLGMWLTGKVDAVTAMVHWVAQFIGGAIGGLVIYIVASGKDGFSIGDAPGAFATNGFKELSPDGYSLLAVIVLELILTAVFMFVVLQTTNDSFPKGFGGIAAGLTLTLIHLIAIPVSNTSVNPARSLGVALFNLGALKQVWVFLLVPFLGAVVGSAIYLFFNSEEKKTVKAEETISEDA